MVQTQNSNKTPLEITPINKEIKNSRSQDEVLELMESLRVQVNTGKVASASSKSIESKNGTLFLVKCDHVLGVLFTDKEVQQFISQIQRWDSELSLLNYCHTTTNFKLKFTEFLDSQGLCYGEGWFPISRLSEIVGYFNLIRFLLDYKDDDKSKGNKNKNKNRNDDDE